jgi:hypothetical protein
VEGEANVHRPTMSEEKQEEVEEETNVHRPTMSEEKEEAEEANVQALSWRRRWGRRRRRRMCTGTIYISEPHLGVGPHLTLFEVNIPLHRA